MNRGDHQSASGPGCWLDGTCLGNIERAFITRSQLGFQQPTNLSTTTAHRYLSSEPALLVMSVNMEGISSIKLQILEELCAHHKCDVLCMLETHRGPGAVRPRVPGMNLVAEIAHEQYGNVLFIRDLCTCKSTSISSTDNIEIIQATLNGVSVNSYYKSPNQAFDFRSSTTDTPLQVIICDLTVIAHNGDTDPHMMTAP